jgi:branched-chain amino acid aminotransferase
MGAGFTDTYYYSGTALCKTAATPASDENLRSVYEVFKIVAGIPLFFEDHYHRMVRSMSLSGITAPAEPADSYRSRIKTLCETNQKFFGNMELRITCHGDKSISQLGFIAHHYPEPLDYIHGVASATLKSERTNPNAKVKHTETRKQANAFLAAHRVFEVLLVNADNEITEGSRSNVFFIRNNQVFTAPASLVLLGITRKYVIEALNRLHVPMIEKAPAVEELSTFDAAFICGTSPGVLPLKQVDGIALNASNAVLRQVIKTFNDLVQDYLSAYN